jgi:hypothetical protein
MDGRGVARARNPPDDDRFQELAVHLWCALMIPAQRRGLFAGIAILSFGAVVLQIVFTRLYSALFGHHLAFLAISLSLFGVGLGGVLLYVFPSIARPEVLLGRLANISGAAAAGTLAALLGIVFTRPNERFDAHEVFTLTVLYLSSSIPFVLVGLAVAAAVKSAAKDMSRLYVVDLLAAALGGLGAIAALRAGALRAGLIVTIVFALASVVFYLGGKRARENPPPNGSMVATFALCSLVLLAGDVGAPWLKLPKMRWVTTEKVEFQGWNEMSLITVEKPIGGMAWMRMDGSAATAILDQKTTAPLHPDEMGYVLHKDKGPVLIIGAGGGRDIRAALKYGQKEVHAAEINPIVVNDVLGGKYRAFSGDLLSRPEVRINITDGRSFVHGTKLKFRHIVISLVDTWAAASVGALSLTENSLYTVEAFAQYIDRLTPDGTLVVNRWDSEFERLLALSDAALRRAGSAQPSAHMFACSHDRSTALLVKRSALTDEELQGLRKHCKKHKFQEAFAPDVPMPPFRERLTTKASMAKPVDLHPPTDDRPFFFYTVPPGRLHHAIFDLKNLQTSNQGLLMLLGLLGVSLLLAAVFLLGPLLLLPGRVLRAGDRPSRVRALLFFSSVGGAFVLVELALVQNFVVLLGHPVYALSTVLVALLLWAGIGSLLTAGVDPRDHARAIGVRSLALVALLALFAAGLGPLLERVMGASFVVRLGLTIALLAPIGILMGSLVPLAVKLVEPHAPELIPWCWGLNGLFSVVGTAIGTLVALNLGFSALLLAGAAAYLLAAITIPYGVAAAEPAPTASS